MSAGTSLTDVKSYKFLNVNTMDNIRILNI